MAEGIVTRIAKADQEAIKKLMIEAATQEKARLESAPEGQHSDG